MQSKETTVPPPGTAKAPSAWMQKLAGLSKEPAVPVRATDDLKGFDPNKPVHNHSFIFVCMKECGASPEVLEAFAKEYVYKDLRSEVWFPTASQFFFNYVEPANGSLNFTAIAGEMHRLDATVSYKSKVVSHRVLPSDFAKLGVVDYVGNAVVWKGKEFMVLTAQGVPYKLGEAAQAMGYRVTKHQLLQDGFGNIIIDGKQINLELVMSNYLRVAGKTSSGITKAIVAASNKIVLLWPNKKMKRGDWETMLAGDDFVPKNLPDTDLVLKDPVVMTAVSELFELVNGKPILDHVALVNFLQELRAVRQGCENVSKMRGDAEGGIFDTTIAKQYSLAVDLGMTADSKKEGPYDQNTPVLVGSGAYHITSVVGILARFVEIALFKGSMSVDYKDPNAKLVMRNASVLSDAFLMSAPQQNETGIKQAVASVETLTKQSAQETPSKHTTPIVLDLLACLPAVLIVKTFATTTPSEARQICAFTRHYRLVQIIQGGRPHNAEIFLKFVLNNAKGVHWVKTNKEETGPSLIQMADPPGLYTLYDIAGEPFSIEEEIVARTSDTFMSHVDLCEVFILILQGALRYSAARLINELTMINKSRDEYGLHSLQTYSLIEGKYVATTSLPVKKVSVSTGKAAIASLEVTEEDKRFWADLTRDMGKRWADQVENEGTAAGPSVKAVKK